MSAESSTATELFLSKNPYRLEECHGKVFKSDILRELRINSFSFRYEMIGICDDDPVFAEKYSAFKGAQKIPVQLAEEIVKKIVDHPSCVVEFYRTQKASIK